MYMCVQSRMHFRVMNVPFFLKVFKFFVFCYFLNHFFGGILLKLNQFATALSYLSKNAITNFRSFPYLDFESLFPPVEKTGDSAILSNQRFKNKTIVKLVIKYKFKSRN